MKILDFNQKDHLHQIRLRLLMGALGIAFVSGLGFAFPSLVHIHWIFQPKTIYDFNATQPGQCFNWEDESPSVLYEIRCDKPHYLEIAAAIFPKDLHDTPWDYLFSKEAPYPNQITTNQIKNTLCQRKTEKFIGHPFYSHGIFHFELLHSTKERWAAGDRTFRCIIEKYTTNNTRIQFEGEIDAADPSLLWRSGTCVIQVDSVYQKISCTKPHELEVTGSATFSNSTFPDLATQDKYYDQKCTEFTQTYLKSPDQLRRTTLTVLWDTISESAWKEGMRTVNCYLGSPTHVLADTIYPTTNKTSTKPTPKSSTSTEKPAFRHVKLYRQIVGSAKGQITIDGRYPIPVRLPPPGERLDPPVPLPPGLEPNPVVIPVDRSMG